MFSNVFCLLTHSICLGCPFVSGAKKIYLCKCNVRRAGLVQLVSASSPSHKVLGSKPFLCRISAG
jgi:hypothetical protein